MDDVTVQYLEHLPEEILEKVVQRVRPVSFRSEGDSSATAAQLRGFAQRMAERDEYMDEEEKEVDKAARAIRSSLLTCAWRRRRPWRNSGIRTPLTEASL